MFRLAVEMNYKVFMQHKIYPCKKKALEIFILSFLQPVTNVGIPTFQNRKNVALNGNILMCNRFFGL